MAIFLVNKKMSREATKAPGRAKSHDFSPSTGKLLSGRVFSCLNLFPKFIPLLVQEGPGSIMPGSWELYRAT
jgi:hypothetical protein